MDSSRSRLPTGVVTFLLTDIEGSTRLWEHEPEAMRQALVRHDAIVNACVRRQQGFVVKSKGEGDSVFAVFPHARDAVTAALVIQCALSAERWPTATPIRVRMAIHTGQIELRDGDYYGPTVNRCARLRALARGGQVLLSGVTAKLTQAQLPSGGGLKDLGTHQLKDLAAPERVFQLTHPQMAASDATQPTSRPVSVPSLTRRAYVLTDHLNRSAEGREWGPGARYAVGDIDERIKCFTSPTVAAFMNALNDRVRLPKLWEADVDADVSARMPTVECLAVKTTRQVPLPTLTAMHHARFAVLCTRTAYEDGLHGQEFGAWAQGWLAGHDNSGIAARELADELERSAERGNGIPHPEEQMAANAVRAAALAARTTWLTGRARDEESSRASELAAEAVHTALRITRIDLVAMAEEALPQAPRTSETSCVSPRTSPAAASTARILTALPT